MQSNTYKNLNSSGGLYGWTSTTPLTTYLINGIPTQYLFPNPSLINCRQYIDLVTASNIQQTIYLDPGNYSFNFNYAYRLGYAANPIQIYFDGVLLDTLPTRYNGDSTTAYDSALDTSSKTSWYYYYKAITILTEGSKILQFIGTSSATQRDIGITNVSFTLEGNYQTNVSGALTLSPSIPIINKNLRITTLKI